MGLVEGAVVGAAALGLGAKALLFVHASYSLALVTSARLVPERARAPASREPTFAALVIAHDEEAVIEACVASLLGQTYPCERLRVVVVADNCSDRTAEVARAAGATVLERNTGAVSGKPAALDWALEELSRVTEPDAVGVFDADNVVDPAFFAAIAARLSAGECIVQGGVDPKNPNESWVAATSALGFFAIDVLSQAPRERLGLSAALMGTAWVATREILDEHVRGTRAVTDDLETAALLALAGIRVAYEPAARVLDEKPAHLAAAVRQRERWMRGRFAVMSDRWVQLVAAALGRGSQPLSTKQRIRALDVAVQLGGPSLAFSSVALGSLTALELALRAWLPGPAAAVLRILPPSATLSTAVVGFLAPLGSLLARRPPARMWLAYALEPAYILLSVPLAASGWRRRSRAEWRPTRHGAPTKPQRA